MIILKSENGDFIYLDVVTQYSRSLASQVSSHPVDGSGTVSDHVIKQNPRLQLVGNLSGADFNSGKPDLSPEDRVFIGISQIVVESDVADIISVSYEDNPLTLLPDVIGQFFTDTLPEVEGITDGRSSSYSEKILFSVLRSFYKNKRNLTLYEFDNGTVVETIEDVFITSLNVNETVTSGDSLAFDITLEQVTFSSLVEEEIPEDVQQAFREKTAEKQNKGGEGISEALNGPSRKSDIATALQSLYGG